MASVSFRLMCKNLQTYMKLFQMNDIHQTTFPSWHASAAGPSGVGMACDKWRRNGSGASQASWRIPSTFVWCRAILYLLDLLCHMFAVNICQCWFEHHIQYSWEMMAISHMLVPSARLAEDGKCSNALFDLFWEGRECWEPCACAWLPLSNVRGQGLGFSTDAGATRTTPCTERKRLASWMATWDVCRSDLHKTSMV